MKYFSISEIRIIDNTLMIKYWK